MKYLLIPVIALVVGLRIWLWRRRRARVGAPAGAGTGATEDATPTSPQAPRTPFGGAPFGDALDRFGGDVGLVARREIRERLRGRPFRIGTLIVLLAVAAAITIPVLTKGSASHQRVGVVGTLSAPLRATVVATGRAAQTSVELVSEPTLSAAESALRTGRLNIVLDGPTRIIVNQALSPSDTSTTALLARAISASISLQGSLERAGIAPESAALLAHPRPVPVTSLQPPRHNQAARTTALYGLILTYVLLTQYGTWLLMGVIEEKSSRVIEVLLSTLRPRQLLSGKVIGIGTIAMLQAALIVAVALILAGAEGSTLLHGTAPLGVVSSLLWVVLGYAFYCWVYAAGGSLADRQDQIQSLAFPLQLPILFGYIVSLTALGSGGVPTLVKVLAYLPPTAPFAMPVLVGLGVATWWEFLASVALSIAGTVLLARAASAIYYRAILRTGGRVRLREVLPAKAAST
jgi:ABC-2 type transport system permease protein